MALCLEFVKLGTHKLHVSDLEVVFRELTLVLQEDVAVRYNGTIFRTAPDKIVHGVDALDVHGQALQAIGDLHGNGIDLKAAHLLEIGELRDLHAVEPDLPAKSPGAQRGALPVVLDKTDIVLVRIDANSRQRLKVELLRVLRRGLDQDLELIIVLHAVGILAVTAVGRAATGLGIAGAPVLRTKRAKQRGSMERARAHL